jgi:hypothetical protein
MPPRNRDCSPPHPTVVRVYTVCDESRSLSVFFLFFSCFPKIELTKMCFLNRYLIVRNVPALGCGDDLFKLFASYGDVEE